MISKVFLGDKDIYNKAYCYTTEYIDNHYLQYSSCGIVGNKPSISNTGTSLSITSCSASLRDNSTTSLTYLYSIPETGLTLVSGVTNYIIVSYNSGSPCYQNTTDVEIIDEGYIVPVYTIYLDASLVMHELDWDSLGYNLPNKLHQSIIKTQRFRRQNGLTLSEHTGRFVNITSGRVWQGAIKVILDDFDSEIDEFEFWFHSGGTWVNTCNSGIGYNNIYYDDGTDLIEMNPNKFCILWVFRGIENHKHASYILSSEEYKDLATAREEVKYPTPPQYIQSHKLLVGRIIIEKSASSGFIESAFDINFIGTPINQHNELSGLYGDSPYYHLSETNYNAISGITNMDIYSLTSHTHTVFNNDLTINGNTYITGYTSIDASTVFNNAGLKLHTNVDGSNYNYIFFSQYTSSSAYYPRLVFHKGRGTLESPSTVATNDILGKIQFSGQYLNGSKNAFNQSSEIGSVAAGNFSAGATPSYLYFSTTPIGSATPVERIRINPDGSLLITGATTMYSTLNVTGNITGPIVARNSITSASDSLLLGSATGRINIAAYLSPNAAGSYSLGSSDGYYWTTLYVTNVQGSGNLTLKPSNTGNMIILSGTTIIYQNGGAGASPALQCISNTTNWVKVQNTNATTNYNSAGFQFITTGGTGAKYIAIILNRTGGDNFGYSDDGGVTNFYNYNLISNLSTFDHPVNISGNTIINGNLTASTIYGNLVGNINSVSISASTAVFGSNTNNTTFEADGTMVCNGSATTWRDEQNELIKASLNNPSSHIEQNFTEGTLGFKTTCDINDYAIMNIQINHDWKAGSAVEPHLHWEQSNSGICNWLLQYRWQVNGGQKVTGWTYLTDSRVFTYMSGTTNQISSFGLITPTSYNISDILQFRIIRDVNNDSGLFTGGVDKYTGTANVLSFDIHLETDTLGSRATYVK